MADTKVEIYTDKQGRRRRRVVPINEAGTAPRSKSKSNLVPTIAPGKNKDSRTRMELEKRRRSSQGIKRRSRPIDPRTRMELEKKRKRRLQGFKPMESRENPSPRGNPAVVETYEDARENQMINRNVPTMKHGGEAKTRGMGCAIKGGKFEGVF